MNTLMSRTWIAGLVLLAAVGCSKDNGGGVPNNGNDGANDRYLVISQTSEASYTFAIDDLEKDEVVDTRTTGAIEDITTGNRIMYNGTTAAMGLNYRQGNPSPGWVYQLNADGAVKVTGEFVLPVGFTSLGAFDKYLVASRSGRDLVVDGATKKGAIFYMIDTENHNQVIEKTIVTENIVGNWTGLLHGIVDAGNKEFYVGVELSAVEGQEEPNKDKVYVARIDENMNIKAVYEDDRIGFPYGTYRSARYSHIANDAAGNTYVFSGHGVSGTAKKAGALVILSGANGFDANYYFDIEAQSGGRKFKRVWHVTEDYFLLEFYNEPGVGGGQQPATQYAVVQMGPKSFNWVTNGFPAHDNIDAVGWPFTADGQAYLGVTTSDAEPAVYVIVPKTASAKKGITVTGVTSIQGLAKLSPQSDIN